MEKHPIKNRQADEQTDSINRLNCFLADPKKIHLSMNNMAENVVTHTHTCAERERGGEGERERGREGSGACARRDN